MNSRIRNAFTLIELLTVIAIIGILAAILIPVVGQVRDQARRASCASNLRQCGFAVNTYALDNDGRLPRFGASTQAHLIQTAGPDGFNFLEDMRSYVQDFEVWKCPNYPQAPAIDDPRVTSASPWATYFYYPGRTQPAFRSGPVSHFDSNVGTPYLLDNVIDPSRRVLMQDRVTATGSTWAINHPTNRSNLVTYENTSFPSLQVYRGSSLGDVAGANILFFDLSVSWVPGGDLQDVGAMAQYRVYSRLPE